MEKVITKEGYIPQSQRKKILLLADDIRSFSGIGTVAKEVVLNTAHRFNWVNLGAAIGHKQIGQRLEVSKDINDYLGIEDANVIIHPSNGYGNPEVIRQLLEVEKPDAIFLITDPRYFVWLFEIESEIRRKIPIVYLNIWDEYPAPMYNKEYYESCDALMGISKQTVNINKLVLGDKAKNKIISYVPHGLNEKQFFPITKDHTEYKEFSKFKNTVFGGKEFEFVTLFNSRNIRRKQIPDTILAYKYFIDQLPIEKASKCALVLKTSKVDDHGTDLPAVIEAFCGDDPKYNIYFADKGMSSIEMNYLYNLANVQIQLTSNEGWGLSLTESLLVGNPFIGNVTGGMQDQMRFENEYGDWFTPDDRIPSNNRGTYKKHAPWAFPVFPTNLSIQGSPPTPYIWDDRCRPEDAAEQLLKAFTLGNKELKKRGLLGREWALGDEAGLTGEKMGQRIINVLDNLFDTWTPRERYELIPVGKKQPKVIPHNLIY